MICQLAILHVNNHSLHAVCINHVLHKAAIANKLNHAEGSSAYNTGSQ